MKASEKKNYGEALAPLNFEQEKASEQPQANTLFDKQKGVLAGSSLVDPSLWVAEAPLALLETISHRQCTNQNLVSAGTLTGLEILSMGLTHG